MDKKYIITKNNRAGKAVEMDIRDDVQVKKYFREIKYGAIIDTKEHLITFDGFSWQEVTDDIMQKLFI